MLNYHYLHKTNVYYTTIVNQVFLAYIENKTTIHIIIFLLIVCTKTECLPVTYSKQCLSLLCHNHEHANVVTTST